MISKILLENQEALAVLFSAFIIGGIIKSQGIFLPVFTILSEKVKSKRLALFLISLISGILPVEGRVSVSAPILDSLVHKEHSDGCSHSPARGKIGILDFVATHHYYLWSPLEKSVIIIMAGLGLTYIEVLSYTTFPVIVYLLFLSFIVFKYIDEKDIVLTKTPAREWSVKELTGIFPFVLGLGLSIFYPPYYVFPIVAIYYYVVTAESIPLSELFSFIKWKTLIFVAFVIILSNVFKANSDLIIKTLKFYNLTKDGVPALHTVALAIMGGAIASFLLGSSGKYAGICVALTLVLGIKYFPLIFMVEYCAYLLSPTHKCLAISASYFNTRMSDFYKLIGGLVALMFVSGLAVYFFNV